MLNYLHNKMNVVVNERYCSWVGGRMVSCLSSLRDMWISREEY